MNKKIQKETESSCEYILPDYLGDVKKLLMSSAKVIPSGKFTSEDSVDLAGVVQFDVVYLDAENKLSAASFTSDYDVSVPIGENYRDSSVKTAVSTYGIRLTGPRKISAKCNVGIDGVIMEENSLMATGSAFSEGRAPEVLYDTVKIERWDNSEPIEREFAEETARLEGVMANDIEVITTSAAVRISDTEAIEGGVRVKGVIIISSIIRVDSEQPFVIRREIPFEEDVKIEGALDGASLVADAVISSLTCTANDSEGAASVVANVIMELSAVAIGNEEEKIVKDAYLCECDTEESFERIKYSEHSLAHRCEISASARLSPEDLSIEGLSDFLSVYAVFRIPEIDASLDNKIKAEAQISGIACQINENGECTYSPLKLSLPVTFDVNKNIHLNSGASASVKVSPCYPECTIDSDGIYMKFVTDATVNLSEEKSKDRMVSCNAVGEEKYNSSLSKISVYYPEENESLFSVAKKFHTSVAAIAQNNEISSEVSSFESASSFERLIIR